jgi:ectoine hydroxylase-related dioxygenase (phytanoyl-CoA dioxygenase family)
MDADHQLSAAGGGLDVTRVVAALKRYGCFVIRGALPASALERIADRARRGYDEIEAAFAAGTLNPEAERRCYSYGILRPFEEDLICSDRRPMREHILDMIRRSVLREVVRGYLGRQVTLLIEACHVRRQGPNQIGRPVPLHQDASVMRMPSGRLLNFWVPLIDGAGRVAPGLSFFPTSLNAIVESQKTQEGKSLSQRLYSNFELDERAVRAAVGDLPLWSPVLDRGDVLCLDGWTVHKTAFGSAMTATRYDFEMRFCRTSDLRPGMPGETRSVDLDEWAA